MYSLSDTSEDSEDVPADDASQETEDPLKTPNSSDENSNSSGENKSGDKDSRDSSPDRSPPQANENLVAVHNQVG